MRTYWSTGATLLRSIGRGLATPEFRNPSLHPLHRRWYQDSVVGTATLRAWWSEDRIPVGTKFSWLVQTDPGDHPASCIMVTGSLVGGGGGVKWPDRGVDHPSNLAPTLKSRPIPSLTLWICMDCFRVNFTFALLWLPCFVILIPKMNIKLMRRMKY